MKRAILLAALLAGCLPSPKPAEPRYFSPLGAMSLEPIAIPPSSRERPALRLRAVRSAAYLNERMAWRRAEVEFGFYDLQRWTELPASYAQKALAHELFAERGLRRSTAPTVPTLDVELRAFDEVLAPAHEAVVELGVLLSDTHRTALVDRAVRVRRPIAGGGPVALARALGEALAAAVDELGESVDGALSERIH